MTNSTFTQEVGIKHGVVIQINDCLVMIDLVTVDMPKDLTASIILGRWKDRGGPRGGWICIIKNNKCYLAILGNKAEYESEPNNCKGDSSAKQGKKLQEVPK